MTNSAENESENDESLEPIDFLDEEDQFEKEVKKYLIEKKNILRKERETRNVILNEEEGFYGLEKRLCLCRANEINSYELNDPQEWTLFASPKITSFKQGEIGDCWLIACFAALVEFPELLKKYFTVKTKA